MSFARQLMKNGNYKEAAEEFRIALDSMPDNILAKNGLESAISAPKLKEDGSRYSVKRMEVFNSRRTTTSSISPPPATRLRAMS